MAKIRVDLTYPIFNGSTVVFNAPCDCTGADGLTVNHLGGSQTFTFCDAHGENLSGIGDVFVAGVPVKVILDTTNSKAFIQNGDNNTHLAKVLADMQLDIRHAQSPIESGTYFGTGASDGMSLTFSFVPKLLYVKELYITENYYDNRVYTTYRPDKWDWSFLWIDGVGRIPHNDTTIWISRNDKTISWRANGNDSESGFNYDVITDYDSVTGKSIHKYGRYAYLAIG